LKRTQRVVWTEGMLMTPQHMQQADLYHESLVGARLGALTPHDWGVAALELDPGALAKDEIRIARFQGVLPDGLPLDFDAGDPEAAPARPVGNHFPPTSPILEIFIGVPKEREGVPSIGDGQGQGAGQTRTRFRQTARAVVDGTGEGNRADVAFAERNVVVLFGDEPREDFDAIKIAEVLREDRGGLVLNDVYIPPVLRVGASSFVMGSLRRLLARMLSRQRTIASERSHRDAAAADFTGNDVTRFLQLHALNTAIPMLTHLAENGDLSPRELYFLLIQFAGAFATFSTETDPAAFPKFVYTDLRSTFEDLLALINDLINSTIRETCVLVALDVREGVHLGKFEDEVLLRAPNFVLAVRSDLAREELVQRLPGLCTVASQAKLGAFLRAFTRGVRLQALDRPPPEVPTRPGTVYFLLDPRSEYWRDIRDERSIALALPEPYDPARVKISLFGIPPRPGAPAAPKR
jgi:type VI secretion system protein ImpJ